MSNENTKNESKQEEKQPATQVELTDEQLEQVTGGSIRVPDSPAADFPPGPSIIGVL